MNGEQAIKMPDKNNNILKFNNFHKQQPVPFVIYADFEAITDKRYKDVNKTVISHHTPKHTKDIQTVDMVIQGCMLL